MPYAKPPALTRAAERVHLSQSTVSQQVRRLEEMVGKTLLARSSHQVQITEEGEKLLGYARRIIALNDEAHDVLSDKWRDGILRLGVPEDFAAPPRDCWRGSAANIRTCGWMS